MSNICNTLIIAILLVDVASLQLVLGQQQDVDIRAAPIGADDTQPAGSGGGGQSRTIYSQRLVSPHRMMHFGKRPSIPQSPSFLIESPQVNRIPQTDMGAYSMFLNTDRAGNLVEPEVETVPRSRQQLLEIVDHLLQLTKQEACQTVKGSQLQQEPIKFMKLLNSDGSNSYDVASDVEGQQQHQQQQGEQINQQQNQLDGGERAREAAINVVGRSLPRTRQGNEPFDLSKAHISSLLFGRRITEPPSSLMNYIKKAEPAKMAFMHFG